MSVNLSKLNRDDLLEKVEQIKKYIEVGKDKEQVNQLIDYLFGIEKVIKGQKYGLVFEEHKESVDDLLENHIPLLVEDKELFINKSDKMNFLIEGDNLATLLLLQRTHKEKIDLIYIDPPYNRGKNDFIYDDKFISAEDTFKHSKWLSFMDKRLRVAKDLLSDDGVIFISIDDNEQANLKLLCDMIFSERNFVGTFIQDKQNSQNDAVNIQSNHEYILVYRKKTIMDGTKVKASLMTTKITQKKLIKEGDRFFYKNDTITTRGEGGTLNNRKSLGYTIYYHPETDDKIPVMDYDVELAATSNNENEVYQTNTELVKKGYIPIRPPMLGAKLGCWTWGFTKFNDEKDTILIEEGRGKKKYLVFKKRYVDSSLVYEEDGNYYFDLINEEGNSKSILDFSTNDGAKALSEVMGTTRIFNNPKNVEMIQYFINLHPNKSCTVLDFFAGSGTTGEAVLRQNESDGGKRNFILATNNQNNICKEITYERMKRLIEGYPFTGKKETVLLERRINITMIRNSQKVLAEAKSIEEENKTNFDEIKTRVKDGLLQVVGIKSISSQTDGYEASLKYFKTDFMSIEDKLYYEYADELLSHVRELIEVENAINFVGNERIALVLTDEELEGFVNTIDENNQCEILYLGHDVLTTAQQEDVLKQKNIRVNVVPDYYYKELRG